MNPVVIGNATLYLGDCREILPTLSKVDAVIVDPPYGIDRAKRSNNIKRAKNDYQTETFTDSRAYVVDVCVPALKVALELSGGRGIVTPGSPCLWLYPEPKAIGGFYQPATKGMNSWGFASYQPVLFYGKDPRAGRHISATMKQLTSKPRKVAHPCPKPLDAMEWLVEKGSLPGETVLDFCMGSGTTGIACMIHGRKFVGIEIEPRHFDLACRDIEDAQRQMALA